MAGRPRKTPTVTPDGPAVAAETAPDGTTAVRRRRRRRTTAGAGADYVAETAKLVDAVLKSRGGKGATQDALQSVITWARGIREEGDALKELSTRPRRQKAQAPIERVAAYEMNRALLDGILEGHIVLDVQENGALLFLHANSLMERNNAGYTADEAETMSPS